MPDPVSLTVIGSVNLDIVATGKTLPARARQLQAQLCSVTPAAKVPTWRSPPKGSAETCR